MKKKSILLLAAMMILSGCKSNGRQIDASYNASVYKDYMTEDNRVDSLNYLVTNKEKNLSLLGNLVDGLVETDRYGNLRAAMAQDIGMSYDNGKVWDFSIRGDISWVDSEGDPTGYKVTADDFICGLQYVLDKTHESSFQNQIYSLILNAKEYAEGSVGFDKVGIEAINDYTLRFTLKEPCSYFNTYLLNGGFYPVSRDLLEEVGDAFATSPETMWYNGAYYLNKYSENEIKFEKNEEYFDVGQVTFEEGSIVLVKDDEEALDMFKSGKLSYAYVSDNYATRNGSRIDSHMYMSAMSPESYVFLFNFNSKNEDFKKAIANEDFRRALFYGFNNDEAFVTKTSDAEQEDKNKTEEEAEEDTVSKKQLNTSVQSTIIPMGFATKTDGLDYVTLGTLGIFSGKTNYDKEKLDAYSKAAIEALKGEVSLPIKINVPVCIDDSQQSEELKRMTKDLNSSLVVISPVDYTNKKPDELPEDSTLKSYQLVIESNDYDMTCVALNANNGDPSTYLKEFVSTGSTNQKYSHLNEKVYDSLYQAANAFTNNDQRLMAFAECEAYLLENGFVIPFSHGNLRYKVSSINDYTMPSGTYGLARFKLKGVKALEQAITINERTELKAAYEEAKNSAL